MVLKYAKFWGGEAEIFAPPHFEPAKKVENHSILNILEAFSWALLKYYSAVII